MDSSADSSLPSAADHRRVVRTVLGLLIGWLQVWALHCWASRSSDGPDVWRWLSLLCGLFLSAAGGYPRFGRRMPPIRAMPSSRPKIAFMTKGLPEIVSGAGCTEIRQARMSQSRSEMSISILRGEFLACMEPVDRVKPRSSTPSRWIPHRRRTAD